MIQRRNKGSILDGFVFKTNLLLVILRLRACAKGNFWLGPCPNVFNKMEIGPYVSRVNDPNHLRDCLHQYHCHPICIRRGFQTDVCVWEVLFFYSFTTVETAAHIFFNVGYNLLMNTIVFYLYGCFQEFHVGVEKVAFSCPHGSFKALLSSPLFRHTCAHVFLHIFGSCRFADLHTPFVPSLIDFIVFEIDVGGCLRFGRLYFWPLLIFRFGIFRSRIFIAGRNVFKMYGIFVPPQVVFATKCFTACSISMDVSHIGSKLVVSFEVRVQMMKIVRKQAFYLLLLQRMRHQNASIASRIASQIA